MAVSVDIGTRTGTNDCQCYKHLVNSVLMYDENSEAAHAAMHGGFDLKNHLKRRQGLGGGLTRFKAWHGAGKADDLHPVARTAAPRHCTSMFQRTNTSGLPIRENQQAFLRKTKHTRYMKKLSIALLALTTAHAAMTGEGTALIVAFVLFCHTCRRDVERIWNKYFN